jgi:hypothetical protein
MHPALQRSDRNIRNGVIGHVKWTLCQDVKVCHRVLNSGNCLQIWTVAMDMLNQK